MDSTPNASHDIVARAGDPLRAHHRHELEVGSGINPEVIAQRDYRSVTEAEALDLGFAPYQARAGLAAQLWTTAGVRGNWILKPDEPRRDAKGKPKKYENPDGSQSHFDIHPAAQPLLRDATVPLYWTEGHKKGDSAWSRGLPCISITGVYMFLRGKLTVPDFDEIALEQRTCNVVFDSDVSRNPDVYQARLRLCEALSRQGAKVLTITLPEVA